MLPIRNEYPRPQFEREAYMNLNGVWQSNVNCLLPAGYNSKLGYGAPFKCNMCGVRPLQENYDTDMGLVAEKFGTLV